MADLEFRFDKLIEEHEAFHLERMRTFARNQALPPDLVVEIGSNRGLFLSRLARQWHDRTLLGIEWRKKYVDWGNETLAMEGIQNASFLQGDANLALPIVADNGQIADVFILFPDPWWKKRHRKRRIIQPHFLDLLGRKMSAGGHLWIRTDVGPLADDMRSIIDQHPAFELLPWEEMPVEPFPRTTREEKIIRKRLPIHTLYYRRR